MTEEILLTKEGYENLVVEYDDLISVRRKEVAERLKEAISYGDISENAEYDSAKNEQAELEERIATLEYMIRNAKIINKGEISNDQVNVGTTVLIKDMKTGEQIEYAIVGSTEANPFEGKISNESEVGKNLLGKKAGTKVEIHVPDGVITYKIIEINK